jgi:hypothetical protein
MKTRADCIIELRTLQEPSLSFLGLGLRENETHQIQRINEGKCITVAFRI